MNTTDAIQHLLDHNLQFRAKVTIEQATQILGQCQIYNEIPDTIGNLPQAIANGIGPVDFGRENPNNGTFVNLEISIGNEYSLVIYVQSHTFYRKGDTPERQKEVLEAIAREYRADEVDVSISDQPIIDGAHVVTARFWWD
jgi:hypothetical protein